MVLRPTKGQRFRGDVRMKNIPSREQVWTLRCALGQFTLADSDDEECWGRRGRITRKPTVLLRLSGALKFRYADRLFRGLLFQEPPRFWLPALSLSLAIQLGALQIPFGGVSKCSLG